MAQSIQVDKVASVVYRLGMNRTIPLTSKMEARSGNAIVVRILPEGKSAQELELADGRMVRMYGGDIVVGALGRRRALRGFVGDVPQRIHVGDTLAVLNRGGVVGAPGKAEWEHAGPLECEVLGMPWIDGAIPNLESNVIASVSTLAGLRLPPVVVVSGTSMQSGKTSFLTELVQTLTKKGIRVAAGKLTGVACLRDLLSMKDNGAVETASFQDAGYPSTAGLDAASLVKISKAVIAHLAASEPQLILLELGDGLIGEYGVMDILCDPEVRNIVRLHAFCANDLAGAWGGHRYLSDRGMNVDLFSGPVTDNVAGIEYIESQFNRPAINACKHPVRMAEVVLSLLNMENRRVVSAVHSPVSV